MTRVSEMYDCQVYQMDHDIPARREKFLRSSNWAAAKSPRRVDGRLVPESASRK